MIGDVHILNARKRPPATADVLIASAILLRRVGPPLFDVLNFFSTRNDAPRRQLNELSATIWIRPLLCYRMS